MDADESVRRPVAAADAGDRARGPADAVSTVVLAALLATALASACGGGGGGTASEEVTRADPIVPVDSGLVMVQTAADTLALRVELAETPQQRGTGLMERQSLGVDEGMLFLYDADQPATAAFYMFRTRIPLDIAFMDSTGAIVAIRQMEPCTSPAPEWCETYAPGVPYRSALEANVGFFDQHDVGVGDRVVLVRRFGS